MVSRKLRANAIRILSVDAIQKANSGHPGMPMGMADIAEVLWNDFLNHNPGNPDWPNRDRFILSNGHGSMLQYALLHLTGYAISIEDIQAFRQLHAKTPGHPEYGITPGVETTTGPLGQGFANAVGMALAERMLAEQFNREEHRVIDHYTYCFVGDGCLMEGLSHEVGSLAGTLGLGKLIVFWDDNGISIDGHVSGWCLDDTPKRFEAYGWHVIPNVDGHCSERIQQAIRDARLNIDKPSLICCRTLIGFGAPTVCGTEASHGKALGVSEVARVREQLNWAHPEFVIPSEIYKAWDARVRGRQLEQKWQASLSAYRVAYPELAEALERRLSGQLPREWLSTMTAWIKETQCRSEAIATRQASQNTLAVIVPLLTELLGGSADLSESTLTHCRYSQAIRPSTFCGNYVHYGVREFGMSAMMNGIALYKGFIPYGGTFLTFLDYARNAVRLAAMMRQRVLFVYTHDSVGLGEDGPTHQPIEHLTLLRATPNLSMWRPCDATETAVAWKMAIQRAEGPTSLVLTRQVVPHQSRTVEQVRSIARGGYILWETAGPLEAIIIATGSEVTLAMEAAQKLQQQGRRIRVVSMPSTDTFEAQDEAYQAGVLPKTVSARVAVEAGATLYWYRWVGPEGRIVGIDRFGESAPGPVALKAVGMTGEAVLSAVQSVMMNKSHLLMSVSI